MPARANTKKRSSNVSNLSRKELALVDAIVKEIDVDKLQNINSQSWNDAKDNIKKSPIDVTVDPELRKALSKAVKGLQNVRAPKLANILKLWHAATAFRVKQTQSKSK
jgi:hypothetical protein